MADRTIKPDDTNDLVLQNNDGSSKLELNEDQTVKVTTGSDAGEDFTVNSTQLVVEGDNGNVGIGAASSGEILGIDKSSGDTFIRFDKSGTFKGLVGIADSSASGSTGSSAGDMILRSQNNVILDTAGTTRMFITTGGDVGINQNNPQKRLHVQDDTADFMTRFANDGNDTNRTGIEIQAGLDTPSSSGDCIWIRLADGNNSGKAYIQFKSSSPNAEFAAISDARLKNNISDTDVIGLGILNSIKMRKFDWDEEKTKVAGWSQIGSEKIGYIAQEVEEILPEFVSTDPMLDFKTMGDAGFIPYLIKAVQELSAKVTALENA